MLFTFLVSYFSHGSPNQKPDVVLPTSAHGNEWNLSERTLNRILEARKHYNIDLLKKGAQTIVLVGETHIKGPEAKRLGQRLINEFKLRGVEGTFSREYVEEAFRVHHRGPLLKLNPKVKEWLGLSLLQTHSSTINDAMESDYFLFHDFDSREDILYMNARRVRTLTDNQGHTLTLFTPESFSNFLGSSGAGTVTIHLERNQKVLEAYRENCKKSWFSRCDDLYRMDFRNDGMVEEIIKTLNLFWGFGPLVVVVGSGHVEGIRERLVCMEHFDFRRMTRGIDGEYISKFVNLSARAKSHLDSDVSGPVDCGLKAVQEF